MRRPRTRLLAVALLGALSLAGLPADAAAPVPDGPTAGGFASDNVEYVTHVPLNNDSAGGRIVGKFFYVTSSRDLKIYDISDPLQPQLAGILPLPQEPYFAEEDLDTNGKIALVGSLGTLYVIDVEDKSNPTVISTLGGADQHTISCLLDCKWAYGSEGVIVDLRDATAPEIAGDWGKGMPTGNAHDVTEVKPGFVVTSSQPIMFLDARKDPTKPKLLALGANEDGRLIHDNLWPQKTRDKFLLVGGESGGPTCNSPSAAFMTWDARRWRKTHTFRMIDEYRVDNGLYTDGNSPADLFCAHWFDPHPTYRNGGLVAMAWYEHGTRFLRINSKGKIKQTGYFIPYAGSTSAAYWVSDELLYSVDYNRGIDILRFAGKP
jgi:hypothetical protein